MCRAARRLAREVGARAFNEPVAYVYNPLDYAWKSHRSYVRKYGGTRKKVVFLGMNPGPFGMAQTGVPFGEVNAVRDWLGIEEKIVRPDPEHPKRPIEGFHCTRSEVSGQRLWGLFADRYGSASEFFADHFVVNYCPLVFLEKSGRNRTPDKLPRAEMAPVTESCHRHLVSVLRLLQPEWLVGVGAFAEGRAKAAREALPKTERPAVGRILHPSPASPAANRGWAKQATAELEELKIWS